MSPHALFRSEKAKFAPNFMGKTISSPSQPFQSLQFAASKEATLIAIFSTQLASRMCKPYLEAVESTYGDNSKVGVVRVQFEENWAKMAIVKYYVASRYIAPQYTPQQQVPPLLGVSANLRHHIF
jgi:hypothetical protein